MKKAFLIFSFFLVYQCIARTPDSLIKVTDNFYLITGLGANVCFYITEDGVVVVDAGMFLQAGNIIKSRIASITNKSIEFIIFTHHHFDHIYGAKQLSKKSIVIGHEKIFKNLQHYDSAWHRNYKESLITKANQLKNFSDSLKQLSNPEFAKYHQEYLFTKTEIEKYDSISILYPNLTFSDKMSLYIGNDTINLSYPGYTHTDCSIIVEFKCPNILVTGDFFFNKSMPYIPIGSSTSNLIDQLHYYGQKKYSFVIPGHGDIATSEALLEEAKYLIDLKRKIKQQIDKKKPLEQIQDLISMPEYSHFELQHLLKGEIEAIYREYSVNQGI